MMNNLKDFLELNIPHKPILFNDEMVEATVEGRKTQTRRLQKLDKVNEDPGNWILDGSVIFDCHILHNKSNGGEYWVKCPYGLPGDFLWVREAWDFSDDLEEPYWYRQKYREDWNEETFNRMTWKPSIHMPKEGARIWLMVKSVKIERLKSISAEDAKAEGIRRDKWPEDPFTKQFFYFYQAKNKKDLRDDSYLDNPVTSFYSLWSSIHGHDSWHHNPWVWAVEFEVLSTTGVPSLDLLLPPKKEA